MKKINLTFILLLCSSMAFSQNYIDLVKVDYAASSLNKFDTVKVKTRLQEINGDFTAPIVINDHVTFLTGILYNTNTASFNLGRGVESFTEIALKLGVDIKHNAKWSGTYVLLPKIASDLKKISNRDFQIGGVVLMKYTKTDHLNYKFGVYANSELFGPFIVPLFGFYYLNRSEKFEAKVLLPLSVDLNYSIVKNVRFGLAFRGIVRSYNINTPYGNEPNRYLVKAANDLYAYFQYGTKSGLNFQLGFGRSIGRSYRVYDQKVALGIPLHYFGDDRKRLNTSFADSWLLKLTVFYRLDLSKAKEKKKAK